MRLHFRLHFASIATLVLALSGCDSTTTTGSSDGGANQDAASPTCGTNHGGCDPLTSCTDTTTGVACGACPSGYVGDGLTGCLDVNECLTNNGGCGNATQYTCTNNVGAAPTCADLNECVVDSDGCPTTSRCVNSSGSFSCEPCGTNEIAQGAPGASETCDCAPNFTRRLGVCTASCANGRFFVTADTVIDSTNGREWQRAPEIIGDSGNGRTWNDAYTYCDTLNLSGTGWRLPTKDELWTLVDTSFDNPQIDACAFPNTSTQDWFWTSTTTSAYSAWYIYFGHPAFLDISSFNIKMAVRCVRT